MAGADTNRNLVAALSYLLGFITGVVIILVEKEDKFIRFHAMQSIVVFGALFILNIVIGLIFGFLGPLSFLANLASVLISLVALVVWIVSMVKAYSGSMFKWPIAGDFAERQTS